MLSKGLHGFHTVLWLSNSLLVPSVDAKVDVDSFYPRSFDLTSPPQAGVQLVDTVPLWSHHIFHVVPRP